MDLICTNNDDLFTYLQSKGVKVFLYEKPCKINGVLNVFFPSTHVANVSCNAHTNKYINDYVKEVDEIVTWLESSCKILIITPVIKFDSQYMKDNAPEQYKRLQKIGYHKQVIHEKDIGSLIVPSRIQLRYRGIDEINFDIVKNDNIMDLNYEWIDKHGKQKQQQQHYINVINMTKDKFERRKLRHIPRYTLYSQIYKNLVKRGEM